MANLNHKIGDKLITKEVLADNKKCRDEINADKPIKKGDGKKTK